MAIYRCDNESGEDVDEDDKGVEVRGSLRGVVVGSAKKNVLLEHFDTVNDGAKEEIEEEHTIKVFLFDLKSEFDEAKESLFFGEGGVNHVDTSCDIFKKASAHVDVGEEKWVL